MSATSIFAVCTTAIDQPIVVSDAPGNQWTPAIAASADGQVAVAWDSYEQGNYDVGVRIWAAGQFGNPVPIATSLGAQMRPSLTYDKTGRLWVAYEDSPKKWGKDWGALEKEGVALYRYWRSCLVCGLRGPRPGREVCDECDGWYRIGGPQPPGP